MPGIYITFLLHRNAIKIVFSRYVFISSITMSNMLIILVNINKLYIIVMVRKLIVNCD